VTLSVETVLPSNSFQKSTTLAPKNLGITIGTGLAAKDKEGHVENYEQKRIKNSEREI